MSGFRLALVVMLALGQAGCAAAIARNPVPASLESEAQVVGMGPTPVRFSIMGAILLYLAIGLTFFAAIILIRPATSSDPKGATRNREASMRQFTALAFGLIPQWDENLFGLTDKIDKITLTIDRPKLTPESIGKLKQAQRNNKTSES